MSKRAVITIAPMMVLLIGAFLWVRPNQAKFYSDETLLERASLLIILSGTYKQNPKSEYNYAFRK